MFVLLLYLGKYEDSAGNLVKPVDGIEITVTPLVGKDIGYTVESVKRILD